MSIVNIGCVATLLVLVCSIKQNIVVGNSSLVTTQPMWPRNKIDIVIYTFYLVVFTCITTSIING